MKLALTIGISSLLLTTACAPERRAEEAPRDEPRQNERAPAAPGDQREMGRQENKQHVESRLREMEQKIDELDRHVRRDPQAQPGLQQNVQQLRSQHQQVRNQLRQAEAAPEEAWEDQRQHIDNSLNLLEQQYQRVAQQANFTPGATGEERPGGQRFGHENNNNHQNNTRQPQPQQQR